MKSKLSVIVTTRNSETHLMSCLQSLSIQSRPAFEIIVVDNNSSDKTKKIASQFTKLVFDYGPERSAQRNFGAQQSKGTHLLFLDSDMELSHHVIEDISTHIEKGAEALYIPEVIAGNTWWAKVRTFERSFYNQTSIDAVRVVSNEVFNRAGGFDETLTGPEDWDFDKRVRAVTTPEIIQSAILHHEESLTLQSYLSKKMYYAKDFLKYIEKWGREDSDIRKQFGLWYRYIGVFIENGKWKKLLLNPHLTLSMLCIRTLLGVEYLLRKVSNSKH